MISLFSQLFILQIIQHLQQLQHQYQQILHRLLQLSSHADCGQDPAGAEDGNEPCENRQGDKPLVFVKFSEFDQLKASFRHLFLMGIQDGQMERIFSRRQVRISDLAQLAVGNDLFFLVIAFQITGNVRIRHIEVDQFR